MLCRGVRRHWQAPHVRVRFKRFVILQNLESFVKKRKLKPLFHLSPLTPQIQLRSSQDRLDIYDALIKILLPCHSGRL
jgi:hypothetical protein